MIIVSHVIMPKMNTELSDLINNFVIGDGLVFTIIISWCYARYHTGVIRVKINNNYTTTVAIVRRLSGQAKF